MAGCCSLNRSYAITGPSVPLWGGFREAIFLGVAAACRNSQGGSGAVFRRHPWGTAICRKTPCRTLLFSAGWPNFCSPSWGPPETEKMAISRGHHGRSAPLGKSCGLMWRSGDGFRYSTHGPDPKRAKTATRCRDQGGVRCWEPSRATCCCPCAHRSPVAL